MAVSFDNWTRQKQSQTQFVPKIIIWCPHGDFHLPPLSTPERDPPFAQHDSPGGHVWAVRRWHHFIIILTIITRDALVGRICLITHTLQRLGVWGKSREHFDVQDHHVCSFLLSTVPVFEQCDYTDLCAHLLFIYQQFLHTGKERSSNILTVIAFAQWIWVEQIHWCWPLDGLSHWEWWHQQVLGCCRWQKSGKHTWVTCGTELITAQCTLLSLFYTMTHISTHTFIVIPVCLYSS